MKNTRNIYKMTRTETTDVVIGRNLLYSIGVFLKRYKHTRYILLSDETTKKLYAKNVIASLERLGVPVHVFVLAEGEHNKNMENIVKILHFMLKNNFDKKSAVVALGGGVIGDVATTIAALYHRGIDCVQVPSTLLAQIDSAYGGKGAVNIHEYKNMIGVIHHPVAVIVDMNLLKSLPREQILSGLGEVLKYAIILDKKLFKKLEGLKKIDGELESIVRSCVGLKMKAIIQDPQDVKNARVALNFGHSLGHAVEITSHLTHGEAVAIGMTFAIKISRKINIISEGQATRALRLIKKFGLPQTVSGINIKKVRKIMKKDKKNIGGRTRLVLLKEIGVVSVQENIRDGIINKVLKEIIT
ncbi:MAG: 3-dehydroquinate synthase family protein [Nanoarchaeota archaeon]|nr:3-dehydroquinate synthase family protein [Nanoarchaeota archaeon]